jgi:hypothetical protein
VVSAEVVVAGVYGVVVAGTSGGVVVGKHSSPEQVG